MEVLFSEYDASEIKKRVLNENSNSFKLISSEVRFKGVITDSKIEIMSIESTPTYITGTIRLIQKEKYKSELTLTVSSFDNDKSAIAFITTFSYVLIFIGFLL